MASLNIGKVDVGKRRKRLENQLAPIGEGATGFRVTLAWQARFDASNEGTLTSSILAVSVFCQSSTSSPCVQRASIAIKKASPPFLRQSCSFPAACTCRPNWAGAPQTVPSFHGPAPWLLQSQLAESGRHRDRSPEFRRLLPESPKMPSLQSLRKKNMLRPSSSLLKSSKILSKSPALHLDPRQRQSTRESGPNQKAEMKRAVLSNNLVPSRNLRPSYQRHRDQPLREPRRRLLSLRSSKNSCRFTRHF